MEVILIDRSKFADDGLLITLVRHTQRNVVEVIASNISNNNVVVDRLYACGRKIRSKADRQVLGELSKRYDLETAIYYQMLNKAVIELTAKFALDRLRYQQLPSGVKHLYFTNEPSGDGIPVELPSFQFDGCPEWIQPYDLVNDSAMEIDSKPLGDRAASIDVNDIQLSCCDVSHNWDSGSVNKPSVPSVATRILQQLSPLVGGRSLAPSPLVEDSKSLASTPPKRRMSAPTAASKQLQSIVLVPLSHSPARTLTPERPCSADFLRTSSAGESSPSVGNNNNSNTPKKQSWSLRLAPLKNL